MYSTQGIILKKIDAGERDAFFVIYTKDFGKIRALAQGIKKEEAKLKGHCEPFNLADLQFVLGKKGERLTHAEMRNYWPAIRQRPEKLKNAWQIISLYDQHCLLGQKDEDLWQLLLASFQSLEKIAAGREESFMKEFEIKFLESLGYGGEKDISVLSIVYLKDGETGGPGKGTLWQR